MGDAALILQAGQFNGMINSIIDFRARDGHLFSHQRIYYSCCTHLVGGTAAKFKQFETNVM